MAVAQTIGPRRRPGGRSSRVRHSVFGATLELLAEGGLAALSMEDIAVRAGVNKTTIYRNWPTKTSLLLAASENRSERQIVVKQTGDVEKDLVAFLESIAANITSPLGRALVIASMEPAEPGAMAAKETFWTHRFNAAEGLIRSALRPGASKEDVDAFIEQLIAPVYLRVFVTSKEVNRRYIERLVSAALTTLR